MNVLASILIFFGIVTVRDGKTVFFPNPALTDEQAALCAEVLQGSLQLDRTFTTTTDEDGVLMYTWGDDEGRLTQKGLVPYVAYFATSDQKVKITESEAEPHDPMMGMMNAWTLGMAHVRWWAPETTEECTLSVEYYDDSSYKVIAVLEDDEIQVGANGESPTGVKWKIVGIDRTDDEITVEVETDKGPEDHGFDFFLATTEWTEPRETFAYPDESEDDAKLIYSVTRWVHEEDEEICHFEIRERDPELAKTWEVKDFPLKSE
jgi:hypothetical protein